MCYITYTLLSSLVSKKLCWISLYLICNYTPIPNLHHIMSFDLCSHPEDPTNKSKLSWKKVLFSMTISKLNLMLVELTCNTYFHYSITSTTLYHQKSKPILYGVKCEPYKPTVTANTKYEKIASWTTNDFLLNMLYSNSHCIMTNLNRLDHALS